MFKWLKRSDSKQVANERLRRIMPSGSGKAEEDAMNSMGIEVNLLPQAYAPSNPFSTRNISFLVVSMIILGFLGFNTLLFTEKERVFQGRNQQIWQVLSSYRQLKDHIDNLKEQTELLKQRRDLLLDAIGERQTWSDKLGQIYTHVPAQVWLSEISLKRKKVRTQQASPAAKKKSKNAVPPPEKEVVTFEIAGEAGNLSHIAELIARLDETPFLEKTRLSSVMERELEDRPVLSFEITTQMYREKS